MIGIEKIEDLFDLLGDYLSLGQFDATWVSIKCLVVNVSAFGSSVPFVELLARIEELRQQFVF